MRDYVNDAIEKVANAFTGDNFETLKDRLDVMDKQALEGDQVANEVINLVLRFSLMMDPLVRD